MTSSRRSLTRNVTGDETKHRACSVAVQCGVGGRGSGRGGRGSEVGGRDVQRNDTCCFSICISILKICRFRKNDSDFLLAYVYTWCKRTKSSNRTVQNIFNLSIGLRAFCKTTKSSNRAVQNILNLNVWAIENHTWAKTMIVVEVVNPFCHHS